MMTHGATAGLNLRNALRAGVALLAVGDSRAHYDDQPNHAKNSNHEATLLEETLETPTAR
jgi:hypothetical protein